MQSSNIFSLLSSEQKRFIDRMTDPSSPDTFIALWRMGTGKTRIALAAYALSEFNDCLIITRRVAFGSWVEEIEKCGLDFLVYQDNYTPKNLLRLGPTKKRVLLISAGDLKNVPENFPKGEMLVVDELYLFGNPQSLRSKLIRNISMFCSSRIGLTGTIMPAQDNITIFGVLRALNTHSVLARTATAFRSEYQQMFKGRFGKEFKNHPDAPAKIAEKIAHMVDYNFPEARPTRIQILACDKTSQQAAAIEEMKEFYEHKERTYDFAIQVVNAVNGISDGWFIESDGSVSFTPTLKIERLLALISEILAEGERVVVWCAYHNDIDRIGSELKQPWLEFTARVPFDEAKWKSSFSSIVLATEANGASVNHFADVKYAIYYSINWKLLDLEQSMMRHERKSSKHDGANYYFLQTKGTNDARIYNMVKSSGATEKELVMTLADEIFCQ